MIFNNIAKYDVNTTSFICFVFRFDQHIAVLEREIYVMKNVLSLTFILLYLYLFA